MLFVTMHFPFPVRRAAVLAQISRITGPRVSCHDMARATAFRRRTTRIGLVALAMVTACGGGGPALTPLPAPAPLPDAPLPPVRVAARLILPSRIVSRWQVSTVARITVTQIAVTGIPHSDGQPPVARVTSPIESRDEPRGEQRIESRALVSWTMDRSPIGALRATGQVDSFTVRSTLTSQESATPTGRRNVRTGTRAPGSVGSTAGTSTGTEAAVPTPAVPASAVPAPLLLDAVLDSANARVVTRPLLANECDRPELGAVALARDVLVRIPDGVAVGDRWRDSTVSLVCRTGVPITVYTSTQYQLERMDEHRMILVRTLAATLDGKGGSAFRAIALTGNSTGTQRAEVQRATGVLEKLEGTSTLTLRVSERTLSGVPRVQQVVQRVELKAERVAR